MHGGGVLAAAGLPIGVFWPGGYFWAVRGGRVLAA